MLVSSCGATLTRAQHVPLRTVRRRRRKKILVRSKRTADPMSLVLVTRSQRKTLARPSFRLEIHISPLVHREEVTLSTSRSSTRSSSLLSSHLSSPQSLSPLPNLIRPSLFSSHHQHLSCILIVLHVHLTLASLITSLFRRSPSRSRISG